MEGTSQGLLSSASTHPSWWSEGSSVDPQLRPPLKLLVDIVRITKKIVSIVIFFFLNLDIDNQNSVTIIIILTGRKQKISCFQGLTSRSTIDRQSCAISLSLLLMAC